MVANAAVDAGVGAVVMGEACAYAEPGAVNSAEVVRIAGDGGVIAALVRIEITGIGVDGVGFIRGKVIYVTDANVEAVVFRTIVVVDVVSAVKEVAGCVVAGCFTTA